MMEALLTKLPTHSVILYAVPEKAGFYQKLGFHRLKTAMGKFANFNKMWLEGYIE